MPPLRNLLGLWAFLTISGTASKVGGAGYDVSADCHSCYSSDAGNVTAVELLQTHVDLSSNGAQHAPFAPVKEWTTSPKVLRVSGGILLVCLLFVLGFGSTDILVGVAVFLDLFMTTVLTPLAPTLTADYQLIALLTSSKNIVTCLIAPFTGRFIDGNEAKSMQLGMLCAMFCTLSLAAVKDYWFWLAVRCLSGCSTAATVWGGFALLNRVHSDEAAARTRAMSTATVSLYAGVILGPQAGGLFVDDSGFLFLLLSGAQLCTLFMLLFRLPDLSQQKQTQTDHAAKVGMMSLIMDPDVRNPIIALFLALAFIAALGSTAFEHMVRLGYGQMKQNLTWLLSSVPAILFACLVPALRSLVEGQTLQILAMFLGGASALLCFGSNYILLALALFGASVAAGIVDGNTPAMLADRSQEKYGGTGQVFVLSNVADQIAFVLGPAAGSIVCQHASFHVMCQSFGACMVLYALFLSLLTLMEKTPISKSGKDTGVPSEAPSTK
ncbi:unnamed protein product [Effrenium voratum]|nr:unnamed protein product [Effrenium voratum]